MNTRNLTDVIRYALIIVLLAGKRFLPENTNPGIKENFQYLIAGVLILWVLFFSPLINGKYRRNVKE